MADDETVNGRDQEFELLKLGVKKLEEQIEALQESTEENHREVMEYLRDIADSGSGFSVFES